MNNIEDLILAGFLGALFNQFMNHFLLNKREKKQRKIQSILNKINKIYAPLLINLNLMHKELELWHDIEENSNQQNSPEQFKIRPKIQSHHVQNIIKFRKNILQLLSINYGYISSHNENKILSFLESTQRISLIELEKGFYFVIGPREKHPLKSLTNLISGVLPTKTGPLSC